MKNFTATPTNDAPPSRGNRVMRRVLVSALIGVGGVGVHTVAIHSTDPMWVHGLGGLMATGFAMVVLGLLVVVTEPRVTRLGLRLERACGGGGRGERLAAWVVYGFCAMLAVGAIGVFGWVRGVCVETDGDVNGGRQATERRVHDERGLTVMELIFSILILMILIALLGIGLERFREQARRGVAQVTIRSLYVAMDGYQLDHGAWPTRVDADDIHLTYDPDADPLTDSQCTLNLLSPYYRFSTTDLDWSGVPSLPDPWGVPYFYQIFDPASNDANERAAGEWWQARHLSHPVKIYSVGGTENRSDTAKAQDEGGGYWVDFLPPGGTGVQYAHELEDL